MQKATAIWSPEDVERGRELVAHESSARWELGDLALEVAPLGTHGGNHDGYISERLNHFANEIGIAYSRLNAYRHVAEKWPKPTRVSLVDWSIHRALVSLEDRASVIRTRTWKARGAAEYARARRDEKRSKRSDGGCESFNADLLRDELRKEFGGHCPCCLREAA